ncbi:response regulator transcription factor [Amycolatopsis sp. 195334CR]|uniref:LuxR C-terminal-related transcriptional regulator n=1 Tax=Amycolatopsis sp. 195334CR TaxID=2814588 RepID=UPI001A8E3879|nr:response regulator transcription factor [Amycolatopsis sp. 195334CR]MBN6038813.1 response regulator transcription factor [Amycolatopsis sp. 195334CR]
MEKAVRSIRTVVVDNHMLFRQGIVQMLSVERDVVVVGECGFGRTATALVAEVKPDIVLLDSDRGGSLAVRTLRELSVASPVSKVIVVTRHDEPRLVGNLIAAGAYAYVLKSATREELLVTLRMVHRASGHVVVSVSRETLEGMHGFDRQLLSKREREVIVLVAVGMRNSQIAHELYISEGTVKRHLTNAYTKLGAASRIAAVKKAISLGIVSVADLFDNEEDAAGS